MFSRFRTTVFWGLAILLAGFSGEVFGDPRMIAYYNNTSLPLTQGGEPTVSGYTHYCISFVYSADGTVGDLGYDSIAAWNDKTVIRQDIARQITELQTAGKKVMLSFGGATQQYAALSGDVPALATSLANFVKNPQVENNAYSFQFDGIDIDWEDTAAFTNPGDAGYDGRAFLQSLTTQLRTSGNLPQSEGWLLSHAPQPPYLSGQQAYSGGGMDGYVDVLNNVGDEIDWINMQYYNNPGFNTAAELVASYNEIVGGWEAQPGIPAFDGLSPDKIVLGKPAAPAQAGSGYLELDALKSDVVDPLYAQYGNDFGGVFLWEFSGETGHDPYWGNAIFAETTPEPTTLGLLAIGAAGLLRRRRQKPPVA